MKQEADILDVRSGDAFRGMSFSGYKLGAAVRKLRQSLSERNAETSSYWTAELVCSGHFAELWESFTIVTGERLATTSPRVPIHLAARFATFKSIVQAGYGGCEIEMRNLPDIRCMFSEIVAILCTAPRQHPPQLLKVAPGRDFDLGHLSTRLEASGTDFAKSVFRDEDPNQLFVAVNELCFHLAGERRGCVSACYWVEWIIAFAAHCSRAKQPLTCADRAFDGIDPRHGGDPVWLIWSCLEHATSTRGAHAVRSLDSLKALFAIRYTPGCRRRRRPVLYAAVGYATQNVDYSVPLARNPTALKDLTEKGLRAYKDVKKAEIPEAESGVPRQKSHRENTAHKLRTLDRYLSGV